MQIADRAEFRRDLKKKKIYKEIQRTGNSGETVYRRKEERMDTEMYIYIKNQKERTKNSATNSEKSELRKS